MPIIEITRTGDASVADQLAEMQAWLREARIEMVELEPIQILRARVRYRANFADAADAERFRQRFNIGG